MIRYIYPPFCCMLSALNNVVILSVAPSDLPIPHCHAPFRLLCENYVSASSHCDRSGCSDATLALPQHPELQRERLIMLNQHQHPRSLHSFPPPLETLHTSSRLTPNHISEE